MLCVERLAAARAIPIDAHRFYTAKGPVTPPRFCRSLMAPKRTAPVGQVVAYGITRAVTILKELWPQNLLLYNRPGGLRLAERRRRFPGRVHGQTALSCPRPSGSATRNPQSAIRNPYQESAIRIRNPYRLFFLQGGYRAFLWQGLFAIRKIRTSVNPYRKSVIRIKSVSPQ